MKQDAVLQLHSLLIKEFGGSSGVRDMNLLDSALNRPYATFAGQDLYPTPVDKAAAIFESIVINHPFMDGNKRTAYVLLRLLLLESGLDISASQDEKYDFVIEVTKGMHSIESIKNWIATHLK